MDIIREYEVEEDGIVYVVTEYENGAIVKRMKSSDEEVAPPLDEKEQMELEMAANIEYLTQLVEMQMEV